MDAKFEIVKINVLQLVILLLLASFQQDYVPWNAIGGLNSNEKPKFILDASEKISIQCYLSNPVPGVENEGKSHGICPL